MRMGRDSSLFETKERIKIFRIILGGSQMGST